MQLRERWKNWKFSLKWGLVGIIVTCWLVPIVLISGATSYYITNNINRQIESTLTTYVSNAVRNAVSQMDSAVAASRYASYNPVIKNAHADFQRDGDVTALYSAVAPFLAREYKYSDKFSTTVLYFCDQAETLYYTYSETYYGVQEYREHIHMQVMEMSRQLGSRVGFLSYENRLYMVRNILDSNFEPYAVLTMQLNTTNMFAGIQNVVWGKDASVWLNGEPVTLSGEFQDPEALGIRLRDSDQSLQKLGNFTYIYGTNGSADYSLSYLIRVDSSPLAEELSGFKVALERMMFLLIPLIGLVIWFFSRNISAPIRRLSDQAGTIEKGEFGIQVTAPFRSREFQYLADAFNSMSYQLQNQFERIYKEELALRDARILALQSQINPHFLNNTLEIINWEARLSGNTKVSRMIEALSTMLDAAMDRKSRPIIHIAEEMMYVDAYLYIISERLGKRLTVVKEIDPSLLDLYVPRLIMQPIIENAVEHGIQPQQKGEIIIRIYREEDSLILEVENDGIMSREDEKRIERLLSADYDASQESSNNLGIRNVNQRLKIIYGENSGLTIKMNSQHHAVGRIVIDIDQSKQ